MDVRQEFRDFMIRKGKQEKTTTEYARFIERLSNHSGTDIFSIRSASVLAPLVARYDTGGSDYEEGNVYNGGPRAAIKQYLYFLQSRSPALEQAAQPSAPAPTNGRAAVSAAPPLNQILYGPPGTGKTYHTVDETLAILDPAFLAAHRVDRTKLTERFKELEASQHVRFVTFHQSFSYEDFVEGLRAEPHEATGQLKFLPVNGVFKAICDAAAMPIASDPTDGAEEASGSSARVLIIDEINRGNIARIFGELITLIEPSKRAGAPEALSVVLPYSKKLFKVPSNLYLIGTMNTSDRSLSGLDIALRRRFVFKEMPPRPDLLAGVDVEGIPVDRLLDMINRRIEALLDREHCLGHAYFLPLKADPSLELLAHIFSEQIVPLLKEYFFEDWERIRWVLNDHRKSALNGFVLPSASSVGELFGEDFEGRVQDRSWTINDDAFDRVEAYLGIIDAKAVRKPAPLAANDGSVEYGGYRLERLADSTIKVYDNGVEQVAMPILKQLAKELGVDHFNGRGGAHNTRQLGALVIKAAQRAAS